MHLDLLVPVLEQRQRVHGLLQRVAGVAHLGRRRVGDAVRLVVDHEAGRPVARQQVEPAGDLRAARLHEERHLAARLERGHAGGQRRALPDADQRGGALGVGLGGVREPRQRDVDAAAGVLERVVHDGAELGAVEAACRPACDARSTDRNPSSRSA